MDLVVTSRQALEHGRTEAEVDALVRSRRWRPLCRAVYLTRPDLPSDPAAAHAALVAAVVLASSVPSIGSHRSAAVVHGLPLLARAPAAPVVTRLQVHQDRPPRRRSAVLEAQVPLEHRAIVHGAPVTSLARTAVDLARTTDDVESVVVLDAALRRVDVDALTAVLSLQRGRPGSRTAAGRLAFADRLSESALESVGRLRFHQQGLPSPRLQVDLGDVTGPVGRVDFLWDESPGRRRSTSPTSSASACAAPSHARGARRRETYRWSATGRLAGSARGSLTPVRRATVRMTRWPTTAARVPRAMPLSDSLPAVSV